MVCFCSPEKPLDKDCPEHGYRFALLQSTQEKRDRMKTEVYRAAVQIYTLTRIGFHESHFLGTVPANRDGMFEAVREAIELWEKVEERTTAYFKGPK